MPRQRSILGARDGNVAMMFGLMTPLLLALAGAGIDYSTFTKMRVDFQEIADAASLAGARQYALSGGSGGSQQSLPETIARQLAEKLLAEHPRGDEAQITVATNSDDFTVGVSITGQFTPTMLVGMFRNPVYVDIESEATSSASGKICVIAMNERASAILHVEGDGQLSGNGCGMFANSTNNDAIRVQGQGKIEASLICSAGGAKGGRPKYDPQPLTDCPPKEDPITMRNRDIPDSACAMHTEFRGGAHVLEPGKYCRGLIIDGTTAELRPGVYRISGGALEIIGNANVNARGVTFVFESDALGMTVGADASLTMSAPTVGPTAGMLLYQFYNAPDNVVFKISSNDAREMVGTIYLPKGDLVVDSSAPVAGDSAYTAIITDRLNVKGSANLVLNSDYDSTDVPLPEGLTPSGDVRLRQ